MNGTPTIVVANSDGTGVRTIAIGDWPSWSPNDMEILFERDGVVRIFNADAGVERRIVDGMWPTWSPDGREIAFIDGTGLRVMTIGDSAPRTIVPHFFRTDTYRPFDMGIGKPSWSPDGALIAFEHLGDGDMMPATTFVVGPSGGAPRRLSNWGNGRWYAESDPSWTPKGDQVVMWSYGAGITLVDRVSGTPTSLYQAFPMVAYGSHPQYSPDGRSWSINVRGTNTVEVRVMGPGYPDAIANAMHLSWTHDGKRVVFVRGMP